MGGQPALLCLSKRITSDSTKTEASRALALENRELYASQREEQLPVVGIDLNNKTAPFIKSE